MKKLFSIFSVAFFAVALLLLQSVDVSAADPTTYIVKYDSNAKGWYYQVGSTWDDSIMPQRELYYMLQEIKDGDYVVVDSSEGKSDLQLDFHLGNVTVLPNSAVVITCKSIQDCYLLHDSTVSLYTDVEHAWVYDNVAVNFNNNINYLEHIFTTNPTASICVVGTCYDFYVHNADSTSVHLWNFTDDLVFNNGIVHTAATGYSIEPPSGTPAPIVSNTGSSASTTPTAPSTGSADSEYDDVPKTGESFAFVWLFAAAAVCLAGSYSFKKK